MADSCPNEVVGDCPPIPLPLSDRSVATPVKLQDGSVLDLIALQDIDGCWLDAKQVQAIAGVTVDCPSELAVSPSVFATALAIALLRTRFIDQRGKWQMIERKGLRWLSSQIGDAEAAAVIDRLSAAL
jgi:hypothetical protein